MSDLMGEIKTDASHKTNHTSIENKQFVNLIKKKKSN